ncbi:hypothetical protein HDU87_001785 [Geranomyces variabilis]|uniref:Enoyl reductase (ER) domain-containing protein n=1 Tax=Geranomyces variabilis TaxID=109894 RepID=A0AAD5TMJ2_9FUNG|nr:hypothetical protein HDU87_001785 [Geranomyces variabilis]
MLAPFPIPAPSIAPQTSQQPPRAHNTKMPAPTVTAQRAVEIKEKGVAVVSDTAPIPAVRDGYVLVKVTIIALNPTDWKHVDFEGLPGSRLGCDYAGVVIATGDNLARKFKEGDRIAGFVHGANHNNKEDGAFAEYIVASAAVALHVPDDMSDEDAATLGVGVTTCGQGLFQSLKLPLPDTNEARDESRKETLLIYGGSTATGTLAIQFAKLAGWTVITTCSRKNFDLVRSRGADAVFDYKDADVGAQIRKHTNDKLAYVFDCISLESSAKVCAEAIGSAGGHYSALLGVEVDRPDVESRFTMAYTAFGELFINLFGRDWPAKPEDVEFQIGFWSLVEWLLKEKKLMVHPVDVRPGGLEGAIDGMDRMRKGELSGKKLVYRVAEKSRKIALTL